MLHPIFSLRSFSKTHQGLHMPYAVKLLVLYNVKYEKVSISTYTENMYTGIEWQSVATETWKHLIKNNVYIILVYSKKDFRIRTCFQVSYSYDSSKQRKRSRYALESPEMKIFIKQKNYYTRFDKRRRCVATRILLPINTESVYISRTRLDVVYNNV